MSIPDTARTLAGNLADQLRTPILKTKGADRLNEIAVGLSSGEDATLNIASRLVGIGDDAVNLDATLRHEVAVSLASLSAAILRDVEERG